MKTTNKLITVIIITVLSFLSISTDAQSTSCNSPRLQFSNPVLVNGTALAEGAEYKFPNVMTGVDCYIKVKKFFGGGTLIAMETPGQGYPDAWQPIIGGPGAPVLNRSGVDFEVKFRRTNGTNYYFDCLDISAIDVDGDNGKIGEYFESEGHTNYSLSDSNFTTLASATVPTLLTTTDLGSGRIRVQGPVVNRPSIDTSAMDVKASFAFTTRDQIEVTLGAFVYDNGFTGAAATQRLNCIYFSKIASPLTLLPVNFLSFNAAYDMKKIVLNWETENEIVGERYEVERSFNNNEFVTVGLVLDAFSTVQNRDKYKFIDNSNEIKNYKVVYYRLKETSQNNKIVYSNVIAVKLAGETGFDMQVGPNPFIDNVNIKFESKENTVAQVRISSVTGKVASIKTFNVNKGQNVLHVNGLGNLSAGMYLVQVSVNGVAMNTQKMIKN